MDDTTGLKAPCRLVTPEEVAHLNEHGWVKLKRFVDPDVLARMLELAREKMGEDADSNPLKAGMAPATDGEAQGVLAYFNAERSGGLGNPVLRPLIEEIGKSATLLLGRRTNTGSAVGVRYYNDFFVPKLPSTKSSRHGGNGATAFHQDYITFAVDRTGGMTFWIPLEPYGPEAGTMSFVSGSHRLGVLGDYTTYGGADALEVFPELRELDMSEQMNYELGDITVHTHLTIHGAGANAMDRPRWGYLLIVQPEDVCWNGSPCPNFDTTDMAQWTALNDERFPLIG
ncbi:phytanoyl-CoA dioxygenase family protein [Mycolicibacterium setense]|uniref:Phytanoyl-CoA dioxygenase n=1 Tax=Mycolicibacterium setense TaxID=431269 RepID=A0ABR4YST8_9MYCO|nr:phytanoyl-CoA dioxygenase family protein [Mycolicibacterium setense]KHO19383.1 phytanoyl-CoA dioxygenase [Mycolicibacterium setense]KHO24068.1 phytanoyl-CoA dioxygenase [Mycolicibacterium setense]MCV7113337.1 phytanoyl-CoA dioxygenase family protein [Mycolicibacterium setense]OBB20450.1 phytanoyl-CoA dioxygenase [Mycolicibacterium setense]